MITITTVTSYAELQGIKALQDKNLRKNLDQRSAESEGFLSAEYTIDFLYEMHKAKPSIIAKDGNEVVGYAVVSLREVAVQHPLLEDLILTIEKLSYEETPLKGSRYVVVGQLCVGKNYRGMGLVQKLYNEFRTQLKDQFDYCITDVASSNPRSLKAHLKVGFQVVDTLTYGGISWNVVLWDWR